MELLTTKRCIPCEAGTPPMTRPEFTPYLEQVSGWAVIDDVKIEKNFTFKNFKDALAFVNQVADLAEAEGHHPDIHVHNWNQVRFTLSTHAIKGLSANDFILAAKIDQL